MLYTAGRFIVLSGDESQMLPEADFRMGDTAIHKIFGRGEIMGAGICPIVLMHIHASIYMVKRLL